MDKNLSCHSGGQLFFSSFQDILSITSAALKHITLKRTLFLSFNYLRKIQREIRVSTVAEDVLYEQSALHATFLVAPKATARSLFLCHYAPECRCLRVMERALGNIYILNPLYRPWPSWSLASGRGGIGGEASGSQRTHADTKGGSPALTPLPAVSLELFMVIVLSAFLFLPREAEAQGG